MVNHQILSISDTIHADIIWYYFLRVMKLSVINLQLHNLYFYGSVTHSLLHHCLQRNIETSVRSIILIILISLLLPTTKLVTFFGFIEEEIGHIICILLGCIV